MLFAASNIMAVLLLAALLSSAQRGPKTRPKLIPSPETFKAGDSVAVTADFVANLPGGAFVGIGTDPGSGQPIEYHHSINLRFFIVDSVSQPLGASVDSNAVAATGFLDNDFPTPASGTHIVKTFPALTVPSLKSGKIKSGQTLVMKLSWDYEIPSGTVEGTRQSAQYIIATKPFPIKCDNTGRACKIQSQELWSREAKQHMESQVP